MGRSVTFAALCWLWVSASRPRFTETVKQPYQDSDSLLENGVIDSLGMLELVKVLDSRFHVSVEDEELSPENLDSIESLTAYLRRKGVEE
jgi:acyl carrier protein